MGLNERVQKVENVLGEKNDLRFNRIEKALDENRIEDVNIDDFKYLENKYPEYLKEVQQNCEVIFYD